jgi:tRNA (mo5U34)-methyltransferase
MRKILQDAEKLGLQNYVEDLTRLIEKKENWIHQVDVKGRRYLNTFATLPSLKPSSLDLEARHVRIGEAKDLDVTQRELLQTALVDYMPWRKGPFTVFGIDIDSEWVSWLKWERLKEHMAPLQGRRILDIGSSNGYYMFRMAAAGPEMILGVEPYLTFYFQYRLLNHYAGLGNLYGIPAKLGEMPLIRRYFDTVFFMGVLYHHRAPHDALRHIREMLRPGGELVLETLVIENEEDVALSPGERYGKMNNVYFIPSVSCLLNWLLRSGFSNPRCIDVSPTTSREQRKTEWIQTESLDDFLDPDDPTRTVEGYPAPVRAIVIANTK